MTDKLSNKPFTAAAKELLEELEISQRELARRTQAHGWGHTSTVNFLVRGDMKPGPRAIEQIARALEVPPEHFAEYRLAKARAALDPKYVGLERALKEGLDAAAKALAGRHIKAGDF
jgi:transcriptional regulator with XRE-family HTH domain